MQIKSIAPWFGGKRNLAPWIVNTIGPHRAYWEPFCGSMAVLMAKDKCRMETVNDLNGDLINLARVLQIEELAVKLYEQLNRTLMHEDLFKESAGRIREGGDYDGVDYERAFDYMVAAWLGRNGCAGSKAYNYTYSARYTSNGGHAATRWRSTIDSIPAWHRRLLNVTILRRDAFEIIERIEDKEGTVIYTDPPYLEKSTKYDYDFEDGDHERLAELLDRFKKTRVVVSYYYDERLGELYPGWQILTKSVSKAMSCQGERGPCDVRVTEVLLVNGALLQGLF